MASKEDGKAGQPVKESEFQTTESLQVAPKKQQVYQSLPDDSLSDSLTWWQKRKVKIGVFPKEVLNLETEIKKLMYSLDNTPVSVVEDQGRFTEVMAAFHQYERTAKRDGNYSDLNIVFMKLRTHMDALFSVDLPLHILIMYRMRKKRMFYGCDETGTWITDVINKVEKEDKHIVAHALNAFCERGDFKIMFNPDKSEDKQVSAFEQMEQACLEQTGVRLFFYIFKRVNRGFVYSRMLWISMAMKLHEKRVRQPTRKTVEVWETKLVAHRQRVDLSSGFIKELEAGLELGQLLQLSFPYTFHALHLTDFLATHGDRKLRPLAQITECFKMLKRFVTTLEDAMIIVSSLREVYSDYLVKPVPPNKMKSISCEGTLSGCIIEGIELLDVIIEWLMGLTEGKEMKVKVDQELKGWLLLLHSLGDVTNNLGQHFKHIVKVLNFEGETSRVSEAAKPISTDIRVSHLETIVKEKEDTISKLIVEAKQHRKCLAKTKHSYEARLLKQEEVLQNKEEMLLKTDIRVSHLETIVKEKEDTISNLIVEAKQHRKGLAKTKQSYEARLLKKEEILQNKEEMLQKNEKILQKKEEEIAGHLQVIASKEKEGNDFQSTIEELNTKLEAYDIDESWIQISQDSVPSWKIDRTVLKLIPQTYLGVGAWGVVYSAEFKGEQVAIKHAHKELLSIQGTVQMVKREISILAHIHHPNLVRFIGAVLDHDVESKRDVPIIVLELLDMNLRTAYANENLSQAMMVSIFCDVAYALHYLHEQTTPIIHRDVSAPNILLKKLPNHFYRAKVSDLGSANLARLSTTAGAGAIIYTAPEMFPQEDLMADPPEQTVKVDVYSFGIVMLEVVCREMPVPEKRRALLLTCESRWKVIFDLVRQCTRVSPHDRPTMREILQYICRI